MSVNAIISLQDEIAAVARYLGPATVVAVDGPRVRAELPGGGEIAVELALAFLYEPSVGDVLLVLRADGPAYGIGVLHGRGKATLAIQGDVELHAVDGTLRLVGDKGVRVEGDAVEIDASKLRVAARAVVHRFESLYQRVASLMSVQAGSAHTVVDGAAFTQSESHTIQSKEVVTINGKQIQLG